jgi:cytochrome c-type protein NapC
MAALAHKRYFSGETDRMCVSCHENIGHNRLGYHLEQMGWKKEDSDAQQ